MLDIGFYINRANDCADKFKKVFSVYEISIININSNELHTCHCVNQSGLTQQDDAILSKAFSFAKKLVNPNDEVRMTFVTKSKGIYYYLEGLMKLGYALNDVTIVYEAGIIY